MSVQAKLTEVVSISSWIPSSGTVTFVGEDIAIGARVTTEEVHAASGERRLCLCF